MKLILILINISCIVLPLYGKNLNESENYYAVTTNEHGHIFKLELELLENNKISISHFVCFRCLRFSNKINLEVGFVKTICKDNMNQPNMFSTYCRSTTISTGLYEKQIKGNLNEAVMRGGNALHETEFPYGRAIFTFLDEKEFFDYKNFIENNLFITTTDFKSKLKLKNIEEALLQDNKDRFDNENKVDNKKLTELEINFEQEKKNNEEERLLRKKIEKEKAILEKELKKIKEKIKAENEIIATDNKPPEIFISSMTVKDKKGIVKGVISDDFKIAELIINGEKVKFDQKGNFTFFTFVPKEGIMVNIEGLDYKGLSSTKVLELQRKVIKKNFSIKFSSLNPLKIKGKTKENALAIIIGVNSYLYAPAAKYADRDANYFADFAENVFGISKNNIKLISNEAANINEIKKILKLWMKGYSTPNQSDIYIFFAGHGLASTDGNELYLLPYDGEPRLLEDTALLRSEIFDTVKSINPKSVTVFLDACYSGQTREEDMILADARPIAIVPIESDVPKNFTVFSASSGSEISGSLPEADHGLFSYFLMKGLEGDADANNDKKITNGELHSYVHSNVTREAVRLGREQTPQLQGDENRVLVEFN